MTRALRSRCPDEPPGTAVGPRSPCTVLRRGRSTSDHAGTPCTVPTRALPLTPARAARERPPPLGAATRSHSRAPARTTPFAAAWATGSRKNWDRSVAHPCTPAGEGSSPQLHRCCLPANRPTEPLEVARTLAVRRRCWGPSRSAPVLAIRPTGPCTVPVAVSPAPFAAVALRTELDCPQRRNCWPARP